MIADNRLTENSVWDDRMLAEQLKELSVLDLDFSLEATGFEMGEIDMRIEGLTADSEDNTALEESASTLPAGPPVTRVGDLWAAGLASGALWKCARPGCLYSPHARRSGEDGVR